MKCNKCGSEIKNEALDHCLCCGERIERKSCVKLSTLFLVVSLDFIDLFREGRFLE